MIGVLSGVALPRRVTGRLGERLVPSSFRTPVLVPGSRSCISSGMAIGELGLLGRTGLRTDLDGGLGTPDFPSSIRDVLEVRCRD